MLSRSKRASNCDIPFVDCSNYYVIVIYTSDTVLTLFGAESTKFSHRSAIIRGHLAVFSFKIKAVVTGGFWTRRCFVLLGSGTKLPEYQLLISLCSVVDLFITALLGDKASSGA